ncbi:flagellar hook-length control protein FliK [Steroidobacter sp.]|uniref:flagellar hook-length control protein FliK n=1 Tax=Steroidobacter sp. TaxID=1978227 RepID=UPI001A461907|nr:flagellar hook-length control protein FliK [Steroidobacter sp.]MBL8266456.1 flagellar hook-length control protein FliK [Steroidobacter sp.]
MRIDLVDFRSTSPAGSTSPSLLSEWRVGALLQAVAVREAASGQLWLDIGGQRHSARLANGNNAGPANGEVLNVRVLRNSPVLALETLSSATTVTADAEATVVADAMRRFVPRQESAALLLANLSWLAQGKNGASELPKAVMQAASQLWQALPDAESLSDPKSLASAILRSGTFLEANLADTARGAANANVLSNDLKALMLTLSRTLKEHGARPNAAFSDSGVNAPIPNARGPLTALSSAPATFSMLEATNQQLNELSRQTDGAIARLTTTQITNTAPDPTVQSMLVELPVRHEDKASMLRLRIEHDGSRKRSGGEDSWSVEAAMDLGQVGALHAKVTLTGHRIGVQLRAESPGIVDALTARAGELEAILRESGLEVDRIVCLHGMPAGDRGTRAVRLLDVHA